MNANPAQMVQWRCRGCGLSSPSGRACPSCGTGRQEAAKLRQLASALHNVGNGSVQNNVTNLAIHGNVGVGFPMPFTEAIDEEEEERPRRREHRSFLASFLLFTSGIAMWLAIIVMFSFVAFFVAVIYKAFFYH